MTIILPIMDRILTVAGGRADLAKGPAGPKGPVIRSYRIRPADSDWPSLHLFGSHIDALIRELELLRKDLTP